MVTPSRWLVEHAAMLPSSGRALDLACGHGRNAFWLAERGLWTDAVDRDVDAIAFVNAEANRRQLTLTGAIMDLEGGRERPSADAYDAIVVVHYLHRPLFPSLIAALRPGGVLVYETFTIAQAARGKPTNPDFLLEPGELLRLVAPLEVLDAREGEFEGRDVASVVAKRVGP